MSLASPILCQLEKKLCRALKDFLEGRENARRLLDAFTVKQNVRRIEDAEILREYAGLNSSYKQVVHNLSRGTRLVGLLSHTANKQAAGPNKVR